MFDSMRPWVLKASLAACSALLASCGGGVSSSSNNSLTSGSTTVPVAVGSPNLTVTAVSFVQANGDLNPTFTCPTNTTHANPRIEWTPGPAGTTYYVVVLDEPDEVAVSKDMATHWLLRTDNNTLAVQTGLTTPTAGIAQSSSSTRLTSNLFMPPVQRDNQTHPYKITVYAMSGAWLIDPINGGGPGDEFSDRKLPQLNTFPTAAGNYYFSGTADPQSFESLFGSGGTGSNFILGKGELQGTINAATPASNGC